MNKSEFDFEDMRQQMDTLKKKLQQQEIVNDRLMRQAVSQKLRRIRFDRWRKLIIIFMGITYVPWMLHEVGIPVWFILLTVIFFATAGIYDAWLASGLNDVGMSDEHLMEMSRKVIRLKQMTNRWLWVGIPFAVVWTLTFIYLLMFKHQLPPNDLIPVLVGVAVGVVVGVVIGVAIYRKQLHHANELISQIEDIIIHEHPA